MITLKVGRVYKTQSGNYLRFLNKGEVMFNFLLVDNENVLIPEKRNRFGHVMIRTQQQYSLESVKTFKLIPEHE